MGSEQAPDIVRALCVLMQVEDQAVRSLFIIVVVVALSIGAAVGWGLFNFEAQLFALRDKFAPAPTLKRPPPVPSERHVKAQPKRVSLTNALLGALEPVASNRSPRLDIARIRPQGVSVFAGTARPFQRISVHSGDAILGLAQADREGNWVLVTDGKIENPDAELRIREERRARDTNGKVDQDRSDGRRREAGSNIADVNRHLMASLQDLVKEAREKADGRELQPSQQLKSGSAHSDNSERSRVEPRGIPIPIQFVYREATFTDQGRTAVRLLLDFLNAAQPDRIRLSGHADERGSHRLNLKLSLERLTAVRSYLSAGGYQGEVTLEPKGEAEPFMGVDRSKLPPQDLYQLDRRVELHLND